MSVGNKKITRVLLVDDYEAIRNGIRFIVNSMEGWEICGEASEGREAIDFADDLKPDVVVMDMNMPGLSGLDATRLIRQSCPETEVLAFTGVGEEKVILQMFEAGARGYVFKTDSSETIQSALVALSQHNSYFTTKVGEVLFAKFLHGKQNALTSPEPGRLAPRERDTQTAELPQGVREIRVEDLAPRMRLAKGIYSPGGLLLVAENQELNQTTISKIKNHYMLTAVNQRILICR